MTTTTWLSMLRGSVMSDLNKAHLPYCKYVQLATMNRDGTPRVRTVVFRDFVDETLSFVTDGRSQKVEELQHQSIVEVVWYFQGSREQFRLRGPVSNSDHY